MARIFEAFIFDCVSVRAVELLTQVLWLLKFLQKKFWFSHLYVRSTINRFFPSSIHFLADLMGQSWIYKQTFGEVLLNSDMSFVWKVSSYIAYDVLIQYVTYTNCLNKWLSYL